MNIEEVKKQLTEIMVSLRSVEHNAPYAKAASHIDYALKELKSATPEETMPSQPDSPEKQFEDLNSAEDVSDEADDTPSGDDDVVCQAGGANPADDANFGLTPAR